MFGLYDAVGKSGWYAFYKMKFGNKYDEKIGSGRSIEAYTIYTYIKNSKEKKNRFVWAQLDRCACDCNCKSIGNKYYIIDAGSDNNIGDEGATAIAKALETNTTLSELDLYHNNIGDEGATAIAKALETNTTLSKLDLNKFGDLQKHWKQIITLVTKAQRQLQKHWKQILHYRTCIIITLVAKAQQ